MKIQATDPIADLLTRIRNANLVGKNEVRVPASKLKLAILQELKKANYIEDIKVEKSKPVDSIIITICQAGQNSNINEITRLSKPGRRVYVKYDQIPKVKNGRGLVLISTSKGILPGYRAVKEKIGGELLLKVF